VSDEAAIYKAFLNHWGGEKHSQLLVSMAADPPESQIVKQYVECAHDAGYKNISWQVSTSKRNLKEVIGNLSYVRLIDPKDWHPRDPDALIAKGHSVGEAVDTGISHALMSFSTITFDKERDLAVFSYSFECGSLCGTGGDVLFVKSATGWVQSPHRCGGWMA